MQKYIYIFCSFFVLIFFVNGKIFSPQNVPGPPEKIFISSADESSLRVQILPPVDSKSEGINGAPILGYKVEVAKRINEIQTFTVSANGNIEAGSYKLSFTNDLGTATTSCIPWNASEIAFEMALEELPNIDGVSVSKSLFDTSVGGFHYTIEFDGTHLVGGSQPNVLVADQTDCEPTLPLNHVLTFSGAHKVVGAQGYFPEIWQIKTFDSSGSNEHILGGSFDISIGFEGDWENTHITATVASGTKTAITSESMVGRINRGDAIRIGDYEFYVHDTAPFTDKELPLNSYHMTGVSMNTPIYIKDTALGDVSVISGSQEVLTSVDFTPFVTVGDHIRIGLDHEFLVTSITPATIQIAKIAITGPDNWPLETLHHITAYKRKKATLEIDANALEVKRALESLPGVGVVDVSRAGPTIVNGYLWYVTFRSLGQATKCPLAPCLRTDKVMGLVEKLTDAFGMVCPSCAVTESLYKSPSADNTVGISGEFVRSSVVSVHEVSGITNEIQELIIYSTKDDLGGSFIINFGNPLYQDISGVRIEYDDPAWDVAYKLESLPTIGRVNVTQENLSGNKFGFSWKVEFISNSGDLPLLTVDSTLLTGSEVNVMIREVRKGVSTPSEAIIDGLSPFEEYFVRAFARNINGYGGGTDMIQAIGKGALPLSTKVGTVPAIPSLIGTWQLSGSELGIRYSNPDNHGYEVQEFRLEYAIGSSFNNYVIKILEISHPVENDITGTFQLQYGIDKTPRLPIGTTASDMQLAINSLPNLRPVTVTRMSYVFTGSLTSCVTSFDSSLSQLANTPITFAQKAMLKSGVTILVGNQYKFKVSAQPNVGDLHINVAKDHGITSFVDNLSVLIFEFTGHDHCPFGCQWKISFVNSAEQIIHGKDPGLQILSSLISVQTRSPITSVAFTDDVAYTPNPHTGEIKISTNPQTCNTIVIGQPAPIQYFRLFASTTIHGGSFKLQLGNDQTSCISLGSSIKKSNIAAALEELPFTSKVSVKEIREFKQLILPGSMTSHVSSYSSSLNELAIVSTGPSNGLTVEEANSLLIGSIIKVAVNANDLFRHICTFTVTTSTSAGDAIIFVSVIGECTSFTGNIRSLHLLDFHDYQIKFWGSHPLGDWPVLKVVKDSFGDGLNCDTWSPKVPVYSQVHTTKYEGECALARYETQTVLAYASSEISGYFTLSYRGRETNALSFKQTSSLAIQQALNSITDDFVDVVVSTSSQSTYGKAWHITFKYNAAGYFENDIISVKHSYLKGTDVSIGVYPTVQLSSEAIESDLSGSFFLEFAGEQTEPIGFSATHAKMVQELSKLSNIFSVIALGNVAESDMGVQHLRLTADALSGSTTLTNLKLRGVRINPSRFLAINEKLVINGIPYYIKNVSPVDITLSATLSDTFTDSIIEAGQITLQSKELPGYARISPLIQVLTAIYGTQTIELASFHGFVVGDVFYISGQKITVVNVDIITKVITSSEIYKGPSVQNYSPILFVYDNILRTTRSWESYLEPGDSLWIKSESTGDMQKYLVNYVENRLVHVEGTFSSPLLKIKAYCLSYGNKWSLVFRSYIGDLKSLKVIPGNDYRGLNARLAIIQPGGASPYTLTVGNPSVVQLVTLEAKSIADVGVDASYTLSFGEDATEPIPWNAKNDVIKRSLELIPTIDGVDVKSLNNGNGYTHLVTFWGMYNELSSLPHLVGSVVMAASPQNLAIYTHANDAVSHSKEQMLLLRPTGDIAFRLFAKNAKGYSGSTKYIHTRSSGNSVVPTPPTSVILGEFHSSTWLSVNYRPPIFTGGSKITMYRLEWDSSSSFDASSPDYGFKLVQKKHEIQHVTTSFRSNIGRGGTFTLAFGARVTPPLSITATAGDITKALATLTDTINFGSNPVKVTRSQSSWGYTWKITFVNTDGDLALLVADGSKMTGDFPQIFVTVEQDGIADIAIGEFTREVQEISTHSYTKLSGSFKLALEGRVTSLISVDASDWEVQEALQKTTTLYSIKVSKQTTSYILNNAIWSVTFAYLKGDEMVGAGNIFSLIVVDSGQVLVGTGAKVKVSNKVHGTDPFEYKLTGLRKGVRYYFHVMAYNSEGFGSASSPLASAVTCGQPSPPPSVTAVVIDGNTLSVAWSASNESIMCAIDKYKIEWYRSEGVQEEQTITTSSSRGVNEIQRLILFTDSGSMSGYFKLVFRGETTENIAWNAMASGTLGSVRQRLERLSTIGTVAVSRKESIRVVSGILFTVAGNTLIRNSEESSILVTDSGLAVHDKVWVLGNEFVIVAMTDTTLTVDGNLESVVAVPIFQSANGFEWEITFLAGHIGPQPLLQALPSDNWSGENPGIYVESVQKGLQPISGTFRVSLAADGISHTTPPLQYDITADLLQDAIVNLVTAGDVKVTRYINGFGYNWVVTFITDIKNDLELMQVDGSQLKGPSVKINVARTKGGVQPLLYCENDGMEGRPIIVNLPAPLAVNIGGLKSGQKYSIRVRAHNSEGYGGARYIVPVFQYPRTVPSEPREIRLIACSREMLKVIWLPPVSDGGAPITSYKVQWDSSSSFKSIGSPSYDLIAYLNVENKHDSRSYGVSTPFFMNIRLPTPDIKYFVRVFALNIEGESPVGLPTPTSIVLSNRAPGPLENVRVKALSSFEILVEWDSSSIDKHYYGGSGGLPITQYLIEWDSSDLFDSPAELEFVDGAKYSHIVGGSDPFTGVRSNILIPGRIYYIRVTAFNALGAGVPVQPTPPFVIAWNQPPTAVRDLQLTVVPPSSIEAIWKFPEHDGGTTLKSYHIEFDEQSDFKSGQAQAREISIVREVQVLTLKHDVVHEEQFVDATVEVVNEEQVVRTTFTGSDEVQVVKTSNLAVVDEVQTVTTSATDRNEVQELIVDGTDINEVQAIRTTVDEAFEVHTIKVGAARVNEIQIISITLFGAAGNLEGIGGQLYFSFDNSVCTHCTLAVGYRRTIDIISSLKESSDTTAADIVKQALEALDNIDIVRVLRTNEISSNGIDLTLNYEVEFIGDGVAGDMSELVVDSTVNVNGISNGGIPTVFSELRKGNEVIYDPASIFTAEYTCESYSDPYSIKSFSPLCMPSITLCTSCVSSFDGIIFTIEVDTLGMDINPNDYLVAGVCVFQVDVVNIRSITVKSNDVGEFCSQYTKSPLNALPLYKAQFFSTAIPLKSGLTTITPASVVQDLLNSIIDSVIVTRTQLIDNSFVGSLYHVTFRKRSGTLPLLRCISDKIDVSNPIDGNSVCSVSRTTIGSGIAGSFQLSLTTESDMTQLTTASIPWDASEQELKNVLEAVAYNGEQVFGTVTVTRKIYSPTDNKWSGGFTWTIEFISRGFNIPTITVANNNLVNTDAFQTGPTISVEDGDHPFNPYANSRHGNQIYGSISFKFRGIQSRPCTLGIDTSLDNVQDSIIDTNLANFLVAELSPELLTVEITRSKITQAGGFTWTITFSDPGTGADVPMLELISIALNGAGASAKVREKIKGNQLSGTFELSFNGESTGPILYSSDKTIVEAQLNSLNSIRPSSVSVERTGPHVTPNNQVLSYTWWITFRSSQWADPTSDHSKGVPGNWKGPRAKWDDVWTETGHSKAWGRHVGPMASLGYMITCNKAGLSTTALDNSQDCQCSVTTPGIAPLKGFFRLRMDSTFVPSMSVNSVQISDPIPHNAWATRAESGSSGLSVEEILERMPNIGDVQVSRSIVDTATGGYQWTVTFLHDADGPCEQEYFISTTTRACNSPGNVPAFTIDSSNLHGSSPNVMVCEATLSNCALNTVRNGNILRGDFTSWKVQGDPGFGARYLVIISCALGENPPCLNPITSLLISPGSEDLASHMVAGDRFTIGEFTTCILIVLGVSLSEIIIAPSICNEHSSGMSNEPRAINILLPWNAEVSLVERVLAASCDQSKEIGLWTGGRKVSVSRQIVGKFGEVSWHITFISNPGNTPSGSGDVPNIETSFLPTPGTASYSVSTTQVVRGSEGLGGHFLINFNTAPSSIMRQVAFNEPQERLQRKLTEMNLIKDVYVKRYIYPSKDTGCVSAICSGGWEDKPVINSGARGGFRWKIRFLRVTGDYDGVTFPPGSGNVGPLTVLVGALLGTGKSVDVTTNIPGSTPMFGGFFLLADKKYTPFLPYYSSADTVKQGIESMNLFGEVEVSREYLYHQIIPNAIATLSKGGVMATISGVDDIRQDLTYEDKIRFGDCGTTSLAGTNCDRPITGKVETSQVKVKSRSPIVEADKLLLKNLYPNLKVRIDGTAYAIQKSGFEVQTVAVTLPVSLWDPLEDRPFFRLSLIRDGMTLETNCLRFNEDIVTMENELLTMLQGININMAAGDIKVTRAGPNVMDSLNRKGFKFDIFFLGDSVAGDINQLFYTHTGCSIVTDATVVVSTAVNGGATPHQRLSLATNAGQVVDTSGYFKMILNGKSTGCIKWGATEDEMKFELEETLLAGPVIVSRLGDGESVTEIQRLRMSSNSPVTATVRGYFQLMLKLNKMTSSTSCLPYGISAEDLQMEINSMSNMPSLAQHVSVTRNGDGSASSGYGYEYNIHFTGPLDGGYSPFLGNVNQLEIVNKGVSPCSAESISGDKPALLVETLRDGRAAYYYDLYFLDFPYSSHVPPISLEHESTGICETGWIHFDGNARNAQIEVVNLGGSSAIQTLTIYDVVAPISLASEFKLGFGGQVTSECIAFDDSGPTLELQLNGLQSIGQGGVIVTRDLNPISAPNGFVFFITFVGSNVNGNIPLLDVVLDDALCTSFPISSVISITTSTIGGQIPSSFLLQTIYDGEKPGWHTVYQIDETFSVLKEQIEVQKIVVSNPESDISVSDGAYVLSLKGVMSEPIAWDATEEEVENALIVSDVQAGDIVVTRNIDPTWAPNGYVYNVYFLGDTVAGDLDLMQVSGQYNFNSGKVDVVEVKNGINNIVSFKSNAIPLANPNSPAIPSSYTSQSAALKIYKINGFQWHIKFKSTIGDVPALKVSTSIPADVTNSGYPSAALPISPLVGGSQLWILDNFVQGSSSNSYVLDKLFPGIEYFVRVAASSDIGLGTYSNTESVIPSGYSSEVLNIKAGPALYAQEIQKIQVAATHVTEIQEISTSASQITEIQTFRTTGSPEMCTFEACIAGKIAIRVPKVQRIRVSASAPITTGKFSIGFVRHEADPAVPGSFHIFGTIVETPAISWDASEPDVLAALLALDALQDGDIIVTREGDGTSSFDFGYVYAVTFVGNNVAGEVEKMTVTDALTGCSDCEAFTVIGDAPYSISIEVDTFMAMGTDTTIQQVIVKSDKPVATGSYKLTFDHLGAAVSSSCINFDAHGHGDSHAMESILKSMTNIDNVYVTRHVDSLLAPYGFVYQIFFFGNLVQGPLNTMTYTWCSPFESYEQNSLTTVGVNGDVIVTTVDEGGFSPQNTFVDAVIGTADELEHDLNQLPMFGSALVSRSLSDEQGGLIWTVAFIDSLGNIPQLICAVDAAFAAVSGSSCESSTLTDGNTLTGTFVIDSSAPISFDASAIEVKNTLEAMSWFGSVHVSRSDPTPQMGFTWSITFLEYVGDLPDLIVTSSLVGTGSSVLVREVRKGNTIGGTFKLKYKSFSTTPISWNAKANRMSTNGDGSSLQEILEALDQIGALEVTRSEVDSEGGCSWKVTFLDDTLNMGDLPMLEVDTSQLTGVGVVVVISEVVKGSNAVGDQLRLSFEPPATDNGSPIDHYSVRWDTSPYFNSNPKELIISDPSTLYATQFIVLEAPSISWSRAKTANAATIQALTILSSAVSGDVFSIAFRGSVNSANLIVGVSTVMDLVLALEELPTVGVRGIESEPTTRILEVSGTYSITFTKLQGELPLLKSSVPEIAIFTTIRKGKTNYRKQRMVFSCVATSGVITFTHTINAGIEVVDSVDVNVDALLETVSTMLHSLFELEPYSLRVISSGSQITLCSDTAPADEISVIFDRVYGQIEMDISSNSIGTVINTNADASVSGIYNLDALSQKMSGTFQIGYGIVPAYTGHLNAESSANDVRFALENLPSINTVAVKREKSYHELPGRVDVIHNQVFVTCSIGDTCDFMSSTYGIPGAQIKIGDEWYTIRAGQDNDDALGNKNLYLGDLNGREVGYIGESAKNVKIYEWSKGYIWEVSLLSTYNLKDQLVYIRAKIPRLYPADSKVEIRGSKCVNCVYLPGGKSASSKLVMGQSYYIDIHAWNKNGEGASNQDPPLMAIPNRVPYPPSNVDLLIVSGKQIEVFFSPPAIASTNVHPTINYDINSYIVQWDRNNEFKHGFELCHSCATKLISDVLTTSIELSPMLLPIGKKFTVADKACVLEVAGISGTRIEVVGGHGCPTFSSQNYPLLLHTFPPVVVTGLSIAGTPPHKYLISNLDSGVKYYVRVAAVNSVPAQAISLTHTPPNNRQWSFPLVATTADIIPDPPVAVTLHPRSGTSLAIHILLPSRDGKGTGGAAITHLWIDVDTVSTFNSPMKEAPVEIDMASGNVPQLYAGGPRIYYITGLITGTRYFVQVKTKNSIGYSRSIIAPNPMSPVRPPDGPVNVKVKTLSASPSPINTATVTWQKPIGNGGSELLSYKIEWWRGSQQPEIQVVEIKWISAPSSAVFFLSYGGGQTGAIPVDVTPENMRNALMNIVVGVNFVIGHVKVSRTTVNIHQGYQWRVTFESTILNAGNIPILQFAFGKISKDGVGVTGRVFEATSGISVPEINHPGSREVQVLVTSHPTTQVGGYFRMSFKGSSWSSYLSASINAEELRHALQGIGTIGQITVNDHGLSLNGKIWTISFESFVGNAPTFTIDSSKITPSDAFIGIKDGDNAVDSNGLFCLPGEGVSQGSWTGYGDGIAGLARVGEQAVDYHYYETLDAKALAYTISGLATGQSYFVSVTAKTAVGLGSRVHSNPTTITPIIQVPGQPTNVALTVNPGVATQLLAKWEPPDSDGGAEIRMYRVEYDPSPLFTSRGHQDIWCPKATTNAVWRVQTFRNGLTGKAISNGYFYLTLTRNNLVFQTEPIPWNAVAMPSDEIGDGNPLLSKVFCTSCPNCADICESNSNFPFSRREKSGSLGSKLLHLSTIGPTSEGVHVTRSSMASDGGFTWTITFHDVGDDFTLVPGHFLTCDNNVCDGANYQVTAKKIQAGTQNQECIGSHVVPQIGALNKGQLYYIRVYAFNEIGFSMPTLAPTAQKPMVVPGPPTGVTLQVLSSSELKVIFSPPDDNGGDTITAYSVEWSTSTSFTDVQSGDVLLLSGGAPYYKVISKLNKGVFYYVRVRAKNSQGYGQYQISSPISLNPYTTPGAPTKVSLGITSATMLTVQWNTPDDDGGDVIIGYVVQWDITPTFDSLGIETTKATISNPSQRSYTITMLTPKTKYYVRVLAKNSGGTGTPQIATPSSQIPLNSRPGKPHLLQAGATNTPGELTVNWQNPRIPAHGIPCSGTYLVPESCPIYHGRDVVYGGSSFESYLVQWSDTMDFSGFNWKSVVANSALLTGLESGKIYYVRVLTVNNEGLKSDFCARANSNGYLCPDHLVLLDGSIETGPLVSAIPI